MARSCECLYDVIGLSNACTGQERCSLYVDTLPGIERADFEYLTTQDTILGSEVWEKVQTRAVNRMAQDLQNAMSDRFEVRPIIEDVQQGQWALPHVDLALENKYKGVRIDTSYSRNLAVFVSTVELYAPGALSDAIVVFDLFTGVQLDSIPFTVTAAGFFEVAINTLYEGQSIGVFYDGSIVASKDVAPYGTDYWANVCEPCKCDATHSICAEITKGIDVVQANLEYTCGGMIVNYALHCSLEAWICRNRESIRYALWYLMGVEFFTEVIASKRLNELTLIDNERLSEVATYSNNQYKESLKAFTTGAKIDDPICVECKAKFRRKILIN